ncbi:MAG TPA: hypothetical protein VD813_14905 [Pseudonocardia sp.]|nr:hypothetical protein [Pseudonocardia sp.]
MGSIDSDVVLLACAAAEQPRRGPFHRPAGPPAAPAGVVSVMLPARPGRAEIDPVLTAHDPRRIVVAGADADLAAVLQRLLRTDRLHVEVGYVPSHRSSAAAAAWGLPTGRAAAPLAFEGDAGPVPLVRDDAGGVLVGRAEIRALVGEVYCDHVLVLRGPAPRLVVSPGPGGIAARAGRGRRAPDGRLRAVPIRASAGWGSARGRAVQVGGMPFTVVSDGVAHPREVRRWAWYRHVGDWLLVRPGGTVAPSVADTAPESVQGK